MLCFIPSKTVHFSFPIGLLTPFHLPTSYSSFFGWLFTFVQPSNFHQQHTLHQCFIPLCNNFHSPSMHLSSTYSVEMCLSCSNTPFVVLPHFASTTLLSLHVAYHIISPTKTNLCHNSSITYHNCLRSVIPKMAEMLLNHIPFGVVLSPVAMWDWCLENIQCEMFL